MKRLIYSIVLVFAGQLANAQPFKAETSETFDDNIGNPVFVTSGGSSVFERDDYRQNKVFITIFDKNHQAVVKRKDFNFDSPEYKINNWIEVNGQLIARVLDKKGRKLYAVTIDPQTGEKTAQQPIDNILLFANDPVTGKSAELVGSWKGLSKDEAASRKDFNGIETIGIKIYDAASKQVQEKEFDMMDHQYQNIGRTQILFRNDVVYILWGLHKVTDWDSYKNPQTKDMYITTYNTKTQKFTSKMLFTIPDIVNAEMFMNDKGTACYARFLELAGTTGGVLKSVTNMYESYIISIDPVSLQASKPFYMPEEKVDEFVKSKCKMPDGFKNGFIYSCSVDENGNLNVAQVDHAYIETLSGMPPLTIGASRYATIAVSTLDKNGTEKNAWALPTINTGLNNDKTVVYNGADKNYAPDNKVNFDFAFVSSSTGPIMFIDDRPENVNLPLDQKRNDAKYLHQCATVAVTYKDGEEKQYFVFADDKNNQLHADFHQAKYDAGTKTLLVKVYEGDDYKKCRAAWIRID